MKDNEKFSAPITNDKVFSALSNDEMGKVVGGSDGGNSHDSYKEGDICPECKKGTIVQSFLPHFLVCNNVECE